MTLGRVCLMLLLLLATSDKYLLAGDFSINGHLRGQSYLSSYPDHDVLSESAGSQRFLDGSIDFRLNSTLFITERISLDLAYEAVVTGGQRRKAIATITDNSIVPDSLTNSVPNDDDHLLSLTKIVSEDDTHLVYHRIDRLFLAMDSDYGTITAGRQALTWGNGMGFNPADLVNPFSPTDIVRDYKGGSDLFLYQTGGVSVSDLQLVYVPRKNGTGDIDWDESTAGTKIKISWQEREIDLYGLKNYDDYVVGTGLTGFLGGAVYRTDATFTFLQGEGDQQNYLSVVANLDYAWVSHDRNWYGMIEIYYNGLGYDAIGDALQDEDLIARIARGELFVTGKWYLDAMVQYEFHPLVNCFISFIYNLNDLSFMFQPRVTWDNSPSSQFLVGFDIPVGSSGDEFGSLINEITGEQSSTGTQFYLLYTWFL